jgi:predicted DNA-binding ribbon-helix-helix protein
MAAKDKGQIESESLIGKRSVLIAGHQTSVSLEHSFWRRLKEIAQSRGISLNRLITEIDRTRTGNLSSAIRVFVLDDALDKP